MSSLLDGFFTLGNKTNKLNPSENVEGLVSDLLPELALDMSDDELIDLKNDWIKLWEPYAGQIEKLQNDNQDYWLSKQFTESLGDTHSLVDNLIFEALETFLPIATRPRAEPTVDADESEAGKALADKVRKILVCLLGPTKLAYNLKMKAVVRYWAIYLLGCMKVSWSMLDNDISISALRPQKLILDPNCCIEAGEYTGDYIGEYRRDTASNIIKRFPKKEKYVKDKVKDKMGTKIQYIEWWTDDYVFWTLDNEVLAKSKNPHFNYPKKQPAPVNEYGSVPLDDKGQMKMVEVKGNNHFPYAKKPYVFLSIFSLGLRPHDETSLIQNALPLQDLINKRLRQIDKNADNTNGGLIVSGDFYTKEQAKEAAEALRRGGTIYVPTGDVNAAVRRDTGTPLATFVYESLIDYRNELRNLYGTRGSAPQGTISEKTVRGKMITQTQDSDRIGGGISTFIEQFSSKVVNMIVQFMYVYYDEPHVASILGKEQGSEYVKLVNTELFPVRLTVGIKDGSMVPKDPMTQRNEAIDLAAMGMIDPITFFDRLGFPNPRESAKQLFIWKADPLQLFPDLAAKQAPRSEEKKPVSKSISFKDLPPEGKVQLAAEAGIRLNSRDIVQHDTLSMARDLQKHAIEQRQVAQHKSKVALSR